jgi:hypothetical protein
LGNVPLISGAKTRSISAENPNGAVGGGAHETPDAGSAASKLGKGWKVRPCITLAPGSTTTLADIAGPGTIQHIWITVKPEAYRDCLLRFYWDGEATPSIETPLGDFFACGHALRTKVNSLPIAVNPSGGFNSFWPMPFRKSARVTIENQRWDAIDGFFYQITYALGPVPDEAGYLHAQWRRAVSQREDPQHVILDGIKGQGHYVGTYLAWTQLANGWWGEGEIKFFIDGDSKFPTICGTGTEDYFCGSYDFENPDSRQYEVFNTPYAGLPQVIKPDGLYRSVQRFGMYRWHIMDPVRFDSDLRVTIQALGWRSDGRYLPLQDDIASVAYWYQAEPHAPFPKLPDRDALEVK